MTMPKTGTKTPPMSSRKVSYAMRSRLTATMIASTPTATAGTRGAPFGTRSWWGRGAPRGPPDFGGVKQVVGEPGPRRDDPPDAELLHPLSDDDDRPADGHRHADQPEENQPEVVAREAQVVVAERLRGLRHDDDLEGGPADELEDVHRRRRGGGADA